MISKLPTLLSDVEEETECGVCYKTYGQQEDGSELIKDGQIYSEAHSTECIHVVCNECCKKLYNNSGECPFCREDWSYWLESKYKSETDDDSVSDSDSESSDGSYDIVPDTRQYENNLNEFETFYRNRHSNRTNIEFNIHSVESYLEDWYESMNCNIDRRWININELMTASIEEDKYELFLYHSASKTFEYLPEWDEWYAGYSWTYNNSGERVSRFHDCGGVYIANFYRDYTSTD